MHVSFKTDLSFYWLWNAEGIQALKKVLALQGNMVCRWVFN